MTLDTILPIIGLIIAVTNIVTQVLKKVTWDKIPTNIVVLIVAELLTLTGGAVYAQHAGITITWYMVVGAVVAGFLVAYGAMFGYDKLVETIKAVKK